MATDRKRAGRAVVGRVREVKVGLKPDKGGEDALPAPKGIAEPGPLVEVLGNAAEGDGRVYGGGAADHAAAGEGQRAARATWRVFEAPVVVCEGGVIDVAEVFGQGLEVWIVGSGLDQEDADARVFGDSGGDDASAGAGAGDDQVVLVTHGVSLAGDSGGFTRVLDDV